MKNEKTITERQIFWVTLAVQVFLGIEVGLSFLYGLFYFEKLGGDANPHAITLTAALYLISQGLVVFFDIPAGIIADKYGRKRVIIWSFAFDLLYFVAMAMIAMSHNASTILWLAIASQVVSSIAWALLSGALTAWVVDSIHFARLNVDSSHMIAKTTPYYFVGQLAGTCVALFCYSHGGIVWAFVAGIVTCAVSVTVCKFTMIETQQLAFEKKINFREMLGHIINKLKESKAIFMQYPQLFMIAWVFAIFAFSNSIVACLWPISLKSNFGFGKFSLVWYLTIFVMIATGYMGSVLLSKWVKHKLAVTQPRDAIPTLQNWFFMGAVAVSLPLIVLGIASQSGVKSLGLLFIALLGMRAGYGFLRPCYQILINKIIPTEHSSQRATILSMGSTMMSVMTLILSIPSAGSSGHATTGGWLLPGSLLLGSAVVAYGWLRQRQRMLPGSGLKMLRVESEGL